MKDVFPHRDLLIEDTTVKAKVEYQTYNGKYMSDGERSALYLIAYSLIVPDGSILIIDEPELHFHRALTSRLFDKIEENCKAAKKSNERFIDTEMRDRDSTSLSFSVFERFERFGALRIEARLHSQEHKAAT